jgi:uncharacterized protein involved in oxidation of intracellular sulfur
MKISLIVSSDEPETAWNAFRLAGYALKQGDAVTAFLLGRGVDCEKAAAPGFDVAAQMKAFSDGGGRILACGTCLKSRGSPGTDLCPISTMKDLYELIRDGDRVLTF